MKSQLIILLLIFSIGLFSNLAYGDHPTDPVIVTFDKTDYEYQDTIFMEVKLLAPWESTGNCKTSLSLNIAGEGWNDRILTPEIPPNGLIHTNYTLSLKEMLSGEIKLLGYFFTFTHNENTGNCSTKMHFSETYTYANLNSDYTSILDQHVNDIPEITMTINTNKDSIQSQKTMLDGMYSHMDLVDSGMNDHTLLITSLIDTITSQNTIITTLQTQIDEILLVLENLNDIPEPTEPIISDSPIILSITADDPDNLDDIFSIDDTITIIFDSDTNRPGGVNAQTKAEINDLFTFTEQIGQTYRGKWLSPDTFEITIKSIRQGELTINSTTVTPTGNTLILSADGTSTPSNATSPVLSGDWGIQ